VKGKWVLFLGGFLLKIKQLKKIKKMIHMNSFQKSILYKVVVGHDTRHKTRQY